MTHYLPTEENPAGDAGIEIHSDLALIISEVTMATADLTSPLYGFHDHYWTIEELHEAYKVKTGNDFAE
jgi:hypothetical protein